MADLYLGKIDRLARVLEHEKIDEVIIALPHAAIEEIGPVIAICENYPTQVRIIPEYFKFMSGRFRISRFGAFPFFPSAPIPWSSCIGGFSKDALTCCFHPAVVCRCFFLAVAPVGPADQDDCHPDRFFSSRRDGA